MKNILIFGAGKSSVSLIEYLLTRAPKNQWHLDIIDYDLELARSRIGKSFYASADAFDVRNSPEARRYYIEQSELVISLMPPSLHQLIAQDCLAFRKSLLTASYLDDQVRKMEADIQRSGVLFLYEMGLDPGIDHMSAMRIIQSIQNKGGIIRSFRSFCGGLMSPKSPDNPWHYRISWNPAGLVAAGKAGAIFKEQGKVRELTYTEIFGPGCKQVLIPGLGKLAFYPNRDSLDYLEKYRLTSAETFMRATLRHTDFCPGWNALVQLGLTEDTRQLETEKLSYRQWALAALKPDRKKRPEEQLAGFLEVREQSKVIRQLKYLGLLGSEWINQGKCTSAKILQELLETKLNLGPDGRDLVVMMHEVIFERKNWMTRLESYLVLEGMDGNHTAMARTVGLPLGIIARLILQDRISLRGLQIPVLPEIFLPVLAELEREGIRFEERIH